MSFISHRMNTGVVFLEIFFSQLKYNCTHDLGHKHFLKGL